MRARQAEQVALAATFLAILLILFAHVEYYFRQYPG